MSKSYRKHPTRSGTSSLDSYTVAALKWFSNVRGWPWGGDRMGTEGQNGDRGTEWGQRVRGRIGIGEC